MMHVRLNGETKRLERSSTIQEMVAELDLPAPLILVEHNGIALRRSEWADARLADGDRIEILRVSAGG